MNIQVIHIIQFIFVSQISFGILLIWKSIRYRGLCYLLFFAVFAMSLNLLEDLTSIKGTYLITPPLLLFKGPIFFWFVYRLIYPKKHFTKDRLIHFLPFICAFIFTNWPQFIIALGTLSQLVYVYFSIKLIRKYHVASTSIRSDANRLNIEWVTHVIILFLTIGALDLLRLNLQPLISINANLAGQLFENTFVLILSSFLIFKALQNPELFNNMEEYEKLNATNVKNETDEIYSAIFKTIHELIQSKSLHHKPRLSLSDLSSETGLTTRDVSRAINHIAKQNFCDYINSLRVEDLKKQILTNSSQKISLLNLAYSVGFNSKSSFNAIFKKETGLTPTQFVKKLSK